MTFKEAQALAKKNQNLIGEENSDGRVIEYVIPAPSDKRYLGIFLDSFKLTHDLDESIFPFINEDMTVVGLYVGFEKENPIIHKIILLP
jgi:hypothetical protein